MIELDHADLSVSKQSSLLDCNRTSLYYKRTVLDDTELANQIHEIYLKNKCIYGYRKITAALRHNFGVTSNRKKVARIMREMKIVGLYPRKRIKTTIADLSHQKFAYLLKELIISFPNQGLGYGHHLHCSAIRICLSRGHHRYLQSLHS